MNLIQTAARQIGLRAVRVQLNTQPKTNTAMKEPYKESYQRFKNIDGDKYHQHSYNGWGEVENCYMMQVIRKTDNEPCWVQLMKDGNGYFIFTPETGVEKAGPDLTNEEIFKLTGIMLHKRDSGYFDGKKWAAAYIITNGERSNLGAIVKDMQAWRFVGLPETRYGYKNMQDIGDAIYLLNLRDGIIKQ